MTKANLVVATVKSWNDEILGVGGTVARLIIEGYEVFTLILGEGITSRNKNRDIDKRGFAQIMPILCKTLFCTKIHFHSCGNSFIRLFVINLNTRFKYY